MSRRDDPAFEALLKKVRAYLPDYLQEHGVTFTQAGKTCCIHPQHNDKTPSMGYLKRNDTEPETFLKCFGCGRVLDIFHAANIFDGKPLDGKGFLFDNVYFLAEKYRIPHEKLELSEQELQELKQERLYTAAAEIIVDLIEKYPENQEYVRNRGIPHGFQLEHGIGVVNWEQFITEIQNRGFSREYVKSSGINQDKIGLDRMTITLRDFKGKIVGFDRRYTLFDKEEYKSYMAAGQYYPPKYQITSQEKCMILRKETLLYGIHVAKQHPMKRLDVFESYMDWATAVLAGHPCCAALCGTALTDLQVEVIRECGFRHVNLVLNGDEVGRTNMIKYLEKFRNQKGLRVTAMFLTFNEATPPSDRDVDFYIRAWPNLVEGLSNFFAHQPTSAFDYQLGVYQKEPDMGSLDIVKEMVGFILNEESPIERGLLCRKLADVTGVPEQDIRSEIDTIEDKEVETAIERLMWDLRRARDSRSKKNLLYHAVDTIETMGEKDEVARPDETVSFARGAFEKFANTQEGELGWLTGMSNWDHHLKGLKKSKEVYCFLGGPNVGKSASLGNLCTGIIQHNAEPACIYLSLDDPRETTLAKLMAIASGFNIQDVIFPNERVWKDEDQKRIWVQWRDKILEWVDSGRLVIQGTNLGNSTKVFERLIKTVQDQTGRPVILFGDSFHNIGGEGEDRARFKAAFQWAQDSSDHLDYTSLWSLEMTKAGFEGKGRFWHAAETAKIAYGAKLVGVLYNELHDRREKAEHYWLDQADNPQLELRKRPVVQMEIEKNKVNSFKGTLWFKFHEESARLIPTSREEVEDEIKKMTSVDSGALVDNIIGVADHQEEAPEF